jgi:hypothetical protein
VLGDELAVDVRPADLRPEAGEEQLAVLLDEYVVPPIGRPP